MVADAAIAEVDELMAYWPARQEITRELGRALAPGTTNALLASFMRQQMTH